MAPNMPVPGRMQAATVPEGLVFEEAARVLSHSVMRSLRASMEARGLTVTVHNVACIPGCVHLLAVFSAQEEEELKLGGRQLGRQHGAASAPQLPELPQQRLPLQQPQQDSVASVAVTDSHDGGLAGRHAHTRLRRGRPAWDLFGGMVPMLRHEVATAGFNAHVQFARIRSTSSTTDRQQVGSTYDDSGNTVARRRSPPVCLHHLANLACSAPGGICLLSADVAVEAAANGGAGGSAAADGQVACDCTLTVLLPPPAVLRAAGWQQVRCVAVVALAPSHPSGASSYHATAVAEASDAAATTAMGHMAVPLTVPAAWLMRPAGSQQAAAGPAPLVWVHVVLGSRGVIAASEQQPRPRPHAGGHGPPLPAGPDSPKWLVATLRVLE